MQLFYLEQNGEKKEIGKFEAKHLVKSLFVRGREVFDELLDPKHERTTALLNAGVMLYVEDDGLPCREFEYKPSGFNIAEIALLNDLVVEAGEKVRGKSPTFAEYALLSDKLKIMHSQMLTYSKLHNNS